MKILTPFLIAVFIHLAFIFAGNKVYKPAEVYFEPGESAIEMKLVASIARPQTKTALFEEQKIEDEVVETEEVKEKVVENEPEPVEPEIENEPEPVVFEDEIVDDPESLLKADTKPVEKEFKEKVVKQQYMEEPIETELNETITENVQELIVNEEVLKNEELLDEQVEAETDSIPSTEIVADMLDKGISAPKVTGVQKPEYPYSCRKKGHEGVTILEVVVDQHGNCVDIKIVESAGCEKLDRSAIKVLKKAKFIPAEQFGIKVKGSKSMAFRFRIANFE